VIFKLKRFGRFYMTKTVPERFVRCLLLFLMLSSNPLSADSSGSRGFFANEFEIGAKLIANYAKSAQALQIDGKTATFKTGGAGLRLEADHSYWGRFFISGGGGYSPSEQASFLSVTLSGSARGTFYGYGFERDFQLSPRWDAEFGVDYVAYDLSGDLSGSYNDRQVDAEITTDTTQQEITLGFRYSLSETTSVNFGGGSTDWTLDAIADGTSGAIRATTEARADGSDTFKFIGVRFDVWDIPMSVTLKRSKLSVDNQVDLNTIDIDLILPRNLWF